jgi:uncharacterized protein (DUF2062 family)/SAM-dependent methyltransferase
MLRAARARIHQLVKEILQQNLSPSRLAIGVMVGCLVGCSPLIGLHLTLCIVLAWLFGLNQVVVYGAANISLPPFIPFIGFASVQLGERARHGHWLTVHLADFTWRNASTWAKTLFVDWLIGGVFVGILIGLVAGAVVFFIARRRAARSGAGDASEERLDVAMGLAARRYAGAARRFRYYARMKYRMDPCYRAIAPLVPPGAFTVDLGTGLGMLPVLLGVLGQGRRALGIEWDAAKAASGADAAKGLDGIEIREGDALEVTLPACDVIALVDVLHYHPALAQRALLQRCYQALRPGGRLLVREGDRARSGGARFTRLIERVVTRLGWNRGPEVRFRPIDELKGELEALGLAVRAGEVAGRLHPGNVLLIAERSAEVEGEDEAAATAEAALPS